jgi:hypothetical protein
MRISKNGALVAVTAISVASSIHATLGTAAGLGSVLPNKDPVLSGSRYGRRSPAAVESTMRSDQQPHSEAWPLTTRRQ